MRLVRCAAALVIGLASTACSLVPRWPEPRDDVRINGTTEPGYASGPNQIARWTCMPTTDLKDPTLVLERLDLVLVEDPERGQLLHELTHDWVMAPLDATSEGTTFQMALPATSEIFFVPKRRDMEVQRTWAKNGETSVVTLKQTCPRGSVVRWL